MKTFTESLLECPIDAVELTDEDLEQVSGGCGFGCWGGFGFFPFWGGFGFFPFWGGFFW